MTVHLVKLCVGADSISDLEAWQKHRLAGMKRSGQQPELMHITRNMPRRGGEVLAGGSLYWVIKGFICARQKITELRPLEHDGITHCALVLDGKVVRVRLHPRRAFQGWRYLEAKDAPPDIAKGGDDEDMPEAMRRELAGLGLL